MNLPTNSDSQHTLMNQILQNDIVKLRALEPEDLELLYSWENDSLVWEYSNTLTPYSKYILKTYLENADKDIFEIKQVRFIIELVETKPVASSFSSAYSIIVLKGFPMVSTAIQ